MCIFSLASVFSATIAWFSMVQQQAAANDHMPVEKLERFSKISYYQFTGVPTDESCSFSLTPYASLTYNYETESFSKPVDGEGHELEGFDFVMATYDPMNKHKPMLVIAELVGDINTSSTTALQVVGKTTTTGFLGEKDSQTKLPKYKLGPATQEKPSLLIETISGTEYYPLSSAVCFKSKGFSQDEYEAWIDGKTSYDVTLSQFDDPIDHNFVDVYTDSNNNEVTKFYNESRIYNSGNNAVVKYIAIVVDYYDAAVECIYSTYLGDTTLEATGYSLHYTCDWKWEIG